MVNEADSVATVRLGWRMSFKYANSLRFDNVAKLKRVRMFTP